MSCRKVSCNSNCVCCRKSLRIPSTAIALVGDTLEITVTPVPVDVCQPVCIMLEQPLPAGYFNAKVSIIAGATTIPVVTKCGKNWRIDTDEAFNIIKTRFFDDPNRLIFCGLGLRQCC